MTIQPFDPVVKFILGKVIVFWIAGWELTAINGSKSPFHSTWNASVKFMENLFEAIYIFFPEIRYGPEIRFCSTKHPLDFHIYPATLSKFPGRLYPIITAINIKLKEALGIIRRPAFWCHLLYAIVCKSKAVHKSINQSGCTLRIDHRVPGCHHHLVSIKSFNIVHQDHLKI